MKSILTNRAFLVLLAVSFILPSCKKEVILYETDSEVQKIMEEHNLPSVAACVIKDNKIIWENYYGFSNVENGTRPDKNTIYHIASISKLFIATAIMQQVESGMVELDADINDYLPLSIRNPKFPDDPITVRMLLTHSSSLAWPYTPYDARELNEQFEPDQAPYPSEWVPQFLVPGGQYYHTNFWKDYRPGTQELYSNIGSNVLAFIIEHISGTNFRNYCLENIFIPLGMTNTSYNFSDLEISNIAILYSENNGVIPFTDWRTAASGSLKTSVNDLSKFMITILNKGEFYGYRLLERSSVDAMMTMQRDNSGICLLWKHRYGGWYGHTGGINGASTISDINPEDKVGFIIFCNKHNPSIYPGHELYLTIKQKANSYRDHY